MSLVARTRHRDVVILGGRGTLMARCLAAGLPVASACSGRGACGRCVMTVLRGADTLEPASPRELAVLARNGAETGQRLSCQCRLRGPAPDLLVTTGYW
jgi:ferredoxin